MNSLVDALTRNGNINMELYPIVPSVGYDGKDAAFVNVDNIIRVKVIVDTYFLLFSELVKWLPWHKGHISETQLNYDVLSGPFSGCNFVSYNRYPQQYVGHIGTTESDFINNKVKRLWNMYVGETKTTPLVGIDPFNDLNFNNNLQCNKTEHKHYFGLATQKNEFYSILVFQNLNSLHQYRIVKIVKVTPRQIVFR